MDLFFTILKFAGIIVSGALGILGTATKTRDDENNCLTPWGQWALALTIGGLAVALGAQIAEEVKSKHQAERTSARALRQIRATQTTLESLQRLQFQQSDGEVYATVSFSLTNAAVASELAWLKEFPKRTGRFQFGEVQGFPGIYVRTLLTRKDSSYDKIISIQVTPESPYYPVETANSVLADLIDQMVVSIAILKPTTSSNKTASDLIAQANSVDEIRTSTDFLDKVKSTPGLIDLYFDLAANSAQFYIRQPFRLPLLLKAKERKDLAGLVFSVSVDADGRFGSKPVNKEFDSLLRTARLSTIHIKFGDVDLYLDRHDISKREFTVFGYQYLDFVVPDKELDSQSGRLKR